MGFDPVSDYPLGSRRPDLVRTPSGLSLDEVEAIEDNAIDTPLHDLTRYAAAVGLRLDLHVTAA